MGTSTKSKKSKEMTKKRGMKGSERKENSEPDNANVNGKQAAVDTSTCPYDNVQSFDSVATQAALDTASIPVDNVQSYDNVGTQHQQRATTADNATPSLPYFESGLAFPYQRFNSYNPIVQQSSSAQHAGASYDQTVFASSDSLSYYTSTPSNTDTPSYNTTSSAAFNSATSIQTQPDVGQNTHAHHNNQNFGYWNTPTAFYSYVTREDDLAGLGAQFDNVRGAGGH